MLCAVIGPGGPFHEGGRGGAGKVAKVAKVATVQRGDQRAGLLSVAIGRGGLSSRAGAFDLAEYAVHWLSLV